MAELLFLTQIFISYEMLEAFNLLWTLYLIPATLSITLPLISLI